MGAIYLDIETLQQDPYPWMMRPDEIKAPANYKDPEKIAEYVTAGTARYEQAQRERSSLEPLLGGVIVCVGCAVDDADPVVLVAESGDETGERALLARLWRALERYPTTPIVSWHGAYDWDWVAKRALRHGLPGLAGRALGAKPWGDRLHVDAREPWTRLDSRALARLQDVARYLGIEVPDTATGADVARLWAEDPARVVEHCRSDVRLLREITRIELAAGWLSLEGQSEAETPVPPPRGSALDLASRIDRAQQGRPHEEVIRALHAAEIPTPPGRLRETLDGLTELPTDRLRAVLVALGQRP